MDIKDDDRMDKLAAALILSLVAAAVACNSLRRRVAFPGHHAKAILAVPPIFS
jgi:hypothetical protein